jgi:hypothetical protein
LIAAIVLFTDNQLPALYLVPSKVWYAPNALFADRKYEGKKSPPEWGLNLSQRNLSMLNPYTFEDVVKTL